MDDASGELPSLVQDRPPDSRDYRLPSTVVKEGEKKEKEKERPFSRQPVSPLLVPPLSALLSVSWVVRLVARQRNRHGRDQHKPPVRVCNVRHSSFCRDAFQCAKLADIRARLYLISRAPRALLCLRSHKCVRARVPRVIAPRDGRT